MTVGSLSKSHSMPGLRAGLAGGTFAMLVKHAESLAMCMLFGLPGFIQEAAHHGAAGGDRDGGSEDSRSSAADGAICCSQGLDGLDGIRCSYSRCRHVHA